MKISFCGLYNDGKVYFDVDSFIKQDPKIISDCLEIVDNRKPCTIVV